jgi:hypothetical protein
MLHCCVEQSKGCFLNHLDIPTPQNEGIQLQQNLWTETYQEAHHRQTFLVQVGWYDGLPEHWLCFHPISGAQDQASSFLPQP